MDSTYSKNAMEKATDLVPRTFTGNLPEGRQGREKAGQQVSLLDK